MDTVESSSASISNFSFSSAHTQPNRCRSSVLDLDIFLPPNSTKHPSHNIPRHSNSFSSTASSSASTLYKSSIPPAQCEIPPILDVNFKSPENSQLFDDSGKSLVFVENKGRFVVTRRYSKALVPERGSHVPPSLISEI